MSIAANEFADKWVVGMLATPAIPCPKCDRKTRAEWRCQYCKTKWSSAELEERRRLRKECVNQYPRHLLKKLEGRNRLADSWLFS